MASPATGAPSPAPKGLLLVLPSLVAFQAISTDLYLPALPSIGVDLGASVEEVQLTLSLFLLGFGVAQLAWGPLSDRIGRRPPLLAGTGLYVAASLVCLLAPSIEALVGARFVQAVAACSGVVLGRAVVRDLFEPAEAAKVLAYLGTAMALAPIFGPVLGGWLTMAFGWRSTFAALALFGLLSFLGVLLAVPETNRRKDPQATSPARLAANYGALLGDRRYLARVALAALGYAGIFSFISGSPHVLIDAVGLRPDQYGLCFAAGAAANTAITITGIKPGDQLVAVLELQPPTAASGNAIVANRTSATTITGPNTIRISAGTAGNQVLVIWWSV